MTRFEKGTAFIELSAEGLELLRRFGRVGGEPRERAQRFETPEQGKRALLEQARRLEARGYRAGRSEPNLVRAIQAEPEADAAYLVYADWLLAQGDPRGELIIKMSRSEHCETFFATHAQQLRPAFMTPFQLEWRLGFLRKVTAPAWDCWQVRLLLRHPSALALQELVLQGRPWPELDDWLSVFAVLPPTLRRIQLDAFAGLPALSERVPVLVAST